jgi:hypothetical protein
VDLDRPVPDAGLAKEGIDLDAPDGLVRLLDQPLDTSAEQGQQGLPGWIR